MRRLILLFALLSIAAITSAQKGRIEGRVYDPKTGQPLSGVSVLVKNSNKGVATDLEGRYVITAEPNSRISLVFSYNGVSKEVEDIQVTAGKTTSQYIAL